MGENLVSNLYDSSVEVNFSVGNIKKDWVYSTKWVWLAPYDRVIVSKPSLRLYLNTPFHFKVLALNSNIKIISIERKTTGDQGSQKTVVDIPFFITTESILVKKIKSLKSLNIKINIGSDQSKPIMLVHKSCDNTDISFVQSQEKVSAKNNRVYFSCKVKKNHIRVNFYHGGNWVSPLNYDDYGGYLVFNRKKIDYSEVGSVIEEITLRSKDNSGQVYRYSILNAKSNIRRTNIEINSGFSYKNYSEEIENKKVPSYSQLGLDLSGLIEYSFTNSNIGAFSSFKFTVIPIHLESLGSRVTTFYEFNAGLFKNINTDLPNKKLRLSLGLHILGMSTDLPSWGIDQLIGPKLSFYHIVYDGLDNEQTLGLSYIYNIGSDAESILDNSGFELKYLKNVGKIKSYPLSVNIRLFHSSYFDQSAKKTSKLLEGVMGLSVHL